MTSRIIPRLVRVCLPALALAVVSGCATTDRWLIDPDASSRLYVVSINQKGGDDSPRFVRFDAAGGRLDPATMQVQGRTADGEQVALAVDQVTGFNFRYAAVDTGRMWGARLEPLWQGDAWAPHDPIQNVVCTNGRIVRITDREASLDFGLRVLRYRTPDGTANTIPFAEIACLKTHDGHAGRTVPLVVLMGGFLGAMIGLALAFSGA